MKNDINMNIITYTGEENERRIWEIEQGRDEHMGML